MGQVALPRCLGSVTGGMGQNASETIDNSMYVDDVLDSCETVRKACSLRHDLSDVLSDAGFKLRKWLSNEPSVIAEVPIEDRAQGVDLDR